MTRKKADRQIWQHKFTLSSDNPDDVRLHEFLIGLADNGTATEWMRSNLTALMSSEQKVGTTVVLNAEVPERKVISGNVGKTVQIPAHAFRPVPKPASAKKPAGRKGESGEDFKS